MILIEHERPDLGALQHQVEGSITIGCECSGAASPGADGSPLLPALLTQVTAVGGRSSAARLRRSGASRACLGSAAQRGAWPTDARRRASTRVRIDADVRRRSVPRAGAGAAVPRRAG